MWMMFYVFSLLAIPPAWSNKAPADLARENRSQRAIVVIVEASWCGPCNELKEQLERGDLGSFLLKNAVGTRIDFDTDLGQKVTERYSVLSLPTTLVLDSTGVEIGRMEGFDDEKVYRAEFVKIMKGKKAVAHYDAMLKKDPTNDVVRVSLAKALLARGEVKTAKAMLTEVWQRGGEPGSLAYRAWGRWLLRVKGRSNEAAKHFTLAYERYRGDSAGAGFLYWAAKAYGVSGKMKQVNKIFADWRKTDAGAAKADLYQADLLVHLGANLVQAKGLMKRHLRKNDADAYGYYLLGKIEAGLGNKNAARVQAGLATRLKPQKALFRNFARKMGRPGGRD